MATNTFALFNPRLVFSDDNGETWQSNTVFQTLEGLDTITGDPATKVTEVVRLRSSVTGRVLAMDQHAIFTSDDNGDSWTVRMNLDFNGTGPLDALRLKDVVQIGSRWIAVGNYGLRFPLRGNVPFVLVSNDDGATWGLRPFQTAQTNTTLASLIVAGNGRVVITGSNASVFVSAAAPAVPPSGEALLVREGKTERVPVSRPGVDGSIDANYSTLGSTALPGIDFTPTGGVLHWDAGDMAEKFIALEMPDNAKIDGTRELLFQIAFQTSGGLVGQLESPVSIVDNDGSSTPGVILDGAAGLYTSEAGGSAELGLALQSKPAADVAITVSGLDESEGRLSGTAFTFTPGNWGIVQPLTITGIDDPDPDGDATYNLTFTIATADPSYTALGSALVAVVNTGDEPLPSLGQPVVFSKLPVTLKTAADGSLLLTATGLDPASVYRIESSATLADFADGQNVTGAQLMAGFALPKSGLARYYRIGAAGE
ncbi:MAG: sialidase family protein [Actinomycetota bacterium]|nr:sialidase family protein [Actinomycetota bacterium]